MIAYYGRKDNGTGILRNLTDGGENPPNHQGKKRSEETRQLMRKAMIGKKPNSTSFKVGHAVPEEWMRKSSAAHKGKKPSFTAFVKGMTPWNKGKTGYLSSESRRKIGLSSKGRIPWNKGMAIITHGKINTYTTHGCRCSECHKVAMDYQRRYRARKKAKNGHQGETRSPEWTGQCSERLQ